MRGILVDDTVKVYSEPGNQNISLLTLQKGDEFELGKVTKKNREVWVQITLPAGQSGYIAGETRIFEIKKVQLLNPDAEIREAPTNESSVLKKLEKNAIVTAIGFEKDDEKGWVKVIDSDEVVGFIKGDSRIRVYQEATKAGGKKLMLTGGMFALLGIAFYIYSLTQAQAQAEGASNMSILTVAVVAFGLMQFVQGILQYYKAKKTETEKK